MISTSLLLLLLAAVHSQRVTEPSITLNSHTTDNGVNLLCWLDGFHPEPISVQWFKDDYLLSDKGTTRIFESIINGNKVFSALSQISINAEQWNESSEFTCKATHNAKIFSQTRNKCKAEPKSKPPIHLEKPRLESVLTASQVTVSCVVETAFNAKVSWLEGNKEKKDSVTEERLGDRTVSNLTISTTEWEKLQTITCKATHDCLVDVEKTISIKESVQKTPTVVIRRILADVLNGDSAALECAAKDLPSGELSVTFQANNVMLPGAQYVDLPKGLDTLTARFTVPKTDQRKGRHFTCQIQQSPSIRWTSSSLNLFDDPSVELSLVSSIDASRLKTQKLICFGTGFNPKITWQPKYPAVSEVTMQADGRVKVSSEISVPLQQWNNGEEITCEVSDQDNSKRVQKSTSACAVTPDFAQKAQVYLLGPSISDTRAKSQVPVTCLLLGHRLNLFSIIWKVGRAISSQVNIKDLPTQTLKVHSNGTESVQIVQKISAEKWNAYETVSCELKHLCSSSTQQHTISKTRDLKSPTVRIPSPSDDDLSGFRNTSLLCLIEGFYPADISVHWMLNGKRLDQSGFSNSPVGIRSAFGDYSMHSALVLLGSKREDGTYSCVVNHESSEKPISSTIDNIYASVDESSPSVKLLQGPDELVCLVYNYSPSAINITWLLNSETVQHKYSTSSSAKGPDGKFSIKSHLNVQASEWAPGATYECRVEHITAIITRNITKTEFTEEIILFDKNK